MRLSYKSKGLLILLITLLNIILRFQVVHHEIGVDSFFIHIMINSLTEFGHANWFLNPLSVAGLYPSSYTSSVQFLLSGISQSTGVETESVIFIYCIIIGVLSIFTSYLMAEEIYDDDLFKILVALTVSTSPLVLQYTTWTIPTRALLMVMTPLLVCLLFKSTKSFKHMLLVFILSLFLFVTHHLFYFIIPVYIVFIILSVFRKLKIFIDPIIIRNLEKYTRISGKLEKNSPFLIIFGFIFMFSIPFFGGYFLESSRYTSIGSSYVRYIGAITIFSVGGLSYLIFKNKKIFSEWALLFSIMLLTVLIYKQTYMKCFLPLFIIPLGCIGLINMINSSEKRKYRLPLFVISIILLVAFSGYYQFSKTKENYYNERYLEESTYETGKWMKNNINGIAIANDELLGERVFAISETAHLFTATTILNQIYGFINVNVSDYTRYPLKSEDFWFTGYKGPATGEVEWERNHNLRNSPSKYNISYVVENKKANGFTVWTHENFPSKLLELSYDNNLIYDSGKANIWEIKKTETDKNGSSVY